MSEIKSAVQTSQAPAAIGPYSQAIKSGNLVFVSGQIPLDPSTAAFITGGVSEQTEQVLRNIRAILKATGLGLEHVVKTTVYLQDMAAFGEMNAVYERHFKAPAPARATVQVSGLPKGALIEIDAIAVHPGHGEES